MCIISSKPCSRLSKPRRKYPCGDLITPITPPEPLFSSCFHYSNTSPVNRERFPSSDIASDTDGSLNRRSGGSLAERLKQLQGSGVQGEFGRRIQRPPSQNFRPQSPPVVVPSRGPTPAPRGPTPGPYTNRRPSLSYVPPLPPPSPKPNGGPITYRAATSTPIPAGTSPRQFVPVSSFGPPSPTHSAGSSPEEDEIKVPRVHHEPPIRSPSDFSRTFPPIDELNEREPSPMFPAVPTHAPGASKPMTSSNGVHSAHRPSGVPWKGKQFDMEPRPASTPIPIKRLSAGNRPQTPTHFVGSPGHVQAHQSSPKLNGFAAPETTPTVDLPITSAITPEKLNSLLETRGLNILLLDVRNREEFDKERINHDAIVCLEPLVLTRQG